MLVDNYSHNDNTLFYVTESIPGPQDAGYEYSNIINDYNSQITRCCHCIEICSEDCACTELHMTLKEINIFDKDSHNNDDNTISGYILECNDICTCSENCSNRIVQNGPIKGLKIKNCDNKGKGYGLFSETLIPKGTYICEYAGEILTKSEAQRRHCFNRLNNKMNYIYSLNEIINGKYIHTFIDPSIFGNIGRYINHSCDPTSIVIPVRINCPIPKLAVFSCCDIYPGCEITFSYGLNNMVCLGSEKSIDKKMCLCQSPKCKGTLPFSP